MQLTILHIYTYKRPLILNCRLHAMNFVPVGFFIVFAISNLNQSPIHHSGYLQFNVALLFRYSKSQFKQQLMLYTKCSAKCYGRLCGV